MYYVHACTGATSKTPAGMRDTAALSLLGTYLNARSLSSNDVRTRERARRLHDDLAHFNVYFLIDCAGDGDDAYWRRNTYVKVPEWVYKSAKAKDCDVIHSGDQYWGAVLNGDIQHLLLPLELYTTLSFREHDQFAGMTFAALLRAALLVPGVCNKDGRNLYIEAIQNAVDCDARYLEILRKHEGSRPRRLVLS